MLLTRIACVGVLLISLLDAQTNSTTKSSPLADAQRHFDLSATRASADLRSLESIEASLMSRGMALHPRLAALRMRIESTLDRAGKALDRGDVDTANEETRRADGFVDRLEAQIGG